MATGCPSANERAEGCHTSEPVAELHPDFSSSAGAAATPWREVVAASERATRRALLYFVVPLWQAAAIADWYQQRRTRIDVTAGARESALHTRGLAYR
jgi:hypothetical protein